MVPRDRSTRPVVQLVAHGYRVGLVAEPDHGQQYHLLELTEDVRCR